MDDIETRLAKVEARLAIQELAARYARCVDSRDLDALMTLYVEDVALGDGRTGHAGLKQQFVEALSAFYRSVHQIVGQVIDLVDADHATGTVYCRAEHECGDRWVAMAICYFDTYERRDGTWLFVRRQIRSFYHADIGRGPAIPYDIWPGRNETIHSNNLPQRWTSWAPFWADTPAERLAQLTVRP